MNALIALLNDAGYVDSMDDPEWETYHLGHKE